MTEEKITVELTGKLLIILGDMIRQLGYYTSSKEEHRKSEYKSGNPYVYIHNKCYDDTESRYDFRGHYRRLRKILDPLFDYEYKDPREKLKTLRNLLKPICDQIK